MKRIRISIAGLMALVALVAIDFAMIPAFSQVAMLATRIALFGVLPMAHLLVIDLAIVVSSLERRGEVALSRVTFQLFGGTAIVLVLTMADLAPRLFMMYISNTVGFWVTPGRQIGDIYRFAMGGISWTQAFLAWGAVTPPLLVPAVLAGWVTRGYRLKLLNPLEAESDSGRAFAEERRKS